MRIYLFLILLLIQIFSSGFSQAREVYNCGDCIVVDILEAEEASDETENLDCFYILNSFQQHNDIIVRILKFPRIKVEIQGFSFENFKPPQNQYLS